MATRTTPTTGLEIIERDPDDNRVLECATAAQCEFVVTCVNDLLALRSHLRDQMRERPDLTAITRAGPVIVRGSGPLPTYARDEPRPAGAPALFVGIAQQQGALDQRAQEGRLRKRIRLSLLCGRAEVLDCQPPLLTFVGVSQGRTIPQIVAQGHGRATDGAPTLAEVHVMRVGPRRRAVKEGVGRIVG